MYIAVAVYAVTVDEHYLSPSEMKTLGVTILHIIMIVHTY